MAIYSGRILSGDKRLPAVSGMFYESGASALKAQIEWAFKHPIGPGQLPQISKERKGVSKAFVSPHAGYMYSGPIAAHVYATIAQEGKAETYIIIGPNHTGYGEIVSIYPHGSWLTPLGEVRVDNELAYHIAKESSYANLDEKAHLYEHSVEVQLPFLQYLFESKFRIVPIVMYQQSPRLSKDLADAILSSIGKLKRDVVVIASSDFTHYEPHSDATKKDMLAIEAISRLEADKLYTIINEHNISICGPGPIMTAIYYSKGKGAKKAELLKYATSGDVAGDKSSVVGYAALRFI